MTKKTRAVIGGGAAGHQIAHDLRETMDVTLIDPKTYWEVPMALPRLLVDPEAFHVPSIVGNLNTLAAAPRWRRRS